MHPAAHEWLALQAPYEAHERNALLIKLTTVALCAAGLSLPIPTAHLIALFAVLWLMEGITRTVQARLGARILWLEQGMRSGALAEADACQLHSAWQAQRPGALGLIAEYLAHAARPTAAFPYPLLIGLLFVPL